MKFKNLEVPDYLFQSSNTYFRKATRQERNINLKKSLKKIHEMKKNLANLKTQSMRTQKIKVVSLKGIERKRQGVDKSLTNINEIERELDCSLDFKEDKSTEFQNESFMQRRIVRDEGELVTGGNENKNTSIQVSPKLPISKNLRNSLNLPHESQNGDKPFHHLRRAGSPVPLEMASSEQLSSAIQFSATNVDYEMSTGKLQEGSSIKLLPNTLNSGSNLRAEPQNNICSVCFDNKSDSVFMPCGHGGLCFTCSIEIWKKSDDCYLCRNKIFQILQIELDGDHSHGYYKVIASTEAFETSDTVELDGSEYEIID